MNDEKKADETKPGEAVQSEHQAEIDRLTRKIAALEKENRKVKAAAKPFDLRDYEDYPTRKFRVELPHNKSRVVDAVMPPHAFQVYCEEMGISNTEHQPVITELEPVEEEAAA